MARWCPNKNCAKHHQEVFGAPAYCTTCGQRMSGIKPPSVVPKISVQVVPPQFEYKPKRLEEMDESAWNHYQQRVVANRKKHSEREPALLVKGKFLYHATDTIAFPFIKNDGLRPRDPTWKKYDKKNKIPRFDASKDGFLSMATTQSGAGAMGGSTVLLRMLIGNDISHWDFRKTGGATEVRTTITVPPDKLEYSNDHGTSWQSLK